MRRALVCAVLFFVAACAQPGLAPDPHEHWVSLTSGQIELDAADGTDVALSPGTELGLNTAKATGEVTEVHLAKGAVHVSNIDHVHHDVMHVHVGGHRVELTRAAVLISHKDDTPHVTLLAGQGAAVAGHDQTLGAPGDRLHLSEDGEHRRSQADRAELRALADHVGLHPSTHAILDDG